MNSIHRFNIRIYGIWITEDQQVLLSDEIVSGKKITKFPGGGLEYGEGPANAIKREWQEELGSDIRIIRQFYFTDFFVPSFMDDGSQVISLYFEVEPASPLQVRLTTQRFDFDQPTEGAEAFRKVSLKHLQPSDVAFPIDQEVVKRLKVEKQVR